MDKGKNKVLSADMQKEKQRICECSSGEENKHTETEGNEEGRIKDVDVDFRQIYERYADKSTLIYEFSDVSSLIWDIEVYIGVYWYSNLSFI